MQTALAQKKEQNQSEAFANSPTNDTTVDLREETGTGKEAGLPLFLQRNTLYSSASPPPIQRQPIEENDGLLQASFSNSLLIQTKLTVGAPDDEYEGEADRIAGAVMRMPKSQVQRQPLEEEEEEEEEMVRSAELSPIHRQPTEEEPEETSPPPIQNQEIEEEEEGIAEEEAAEGEMLLEEPPPEEAPAPPEAEPTEQPPEPQIQAPAPEEVLAGTGAVELQRQEAEEQEIQVLEEAEEGPARPPVEAPKAEAGVEEAVIIEEEAPLAAAGLPSSGPVAPPKSAEEMEQQQRAQEESDTATTGGGGAGAEDAIVQQWQAEVQSAGQAIPQPSMATERTQIQQAGQQAADRQRQDQQNIPQEAANNISQLPEVEEPPAPPTTNPVPEHTQRIQNVSDQRLPTQTPPSLVATPRRRVLEEYYVGGNLPELDSTPVSAEMFQLIITSGALDLANIPEDERNNERRALNEALNTLREPFSPRPQESEGQPAPLVDQGPQPMPPLVPEMQTPVAQVVARLLAQPAQATSDVMQRLRTIAYPNGVLQREYPDIGQQLQINIQPELVTELEEIAIAAGVSGQQLDTMVNDRRRELEREATDVQEQTEQAAESAIGDVSESGQQTLNTIAGARLSTDEEIIRRQEQASGGSDPAVIDARRDLVIRWVRNHVTTQTTDYQNAGQQRERLLNQAQTQQENAYNATAQREEYQILNPPNSVPQREQANQERERHFQDLAASVRAWTRQRIENVQSMIRGFKRTTTQTIRRYRSTIETAGTNAIRAARNWAEDRKLQGRSWWERIVATLSRWFSNSQEVNEQWEVRRTQQTRDGIASDLTIVNQIHVQVQQGVTQQQLLQREGLTAEQRAIIQEYFAQQGTRHPLDVAAACLRQRLASNHRAQALPVFERELIAKPDEEFEKLNAVGQAMRPGFDCAQIAQDVHAAMDQIGTDEAAIYNSLQGLNAIQGAAVRKVYRIRFRYLDPHRRDLDQMLREELSGEELDRAQLQLEGRSATADAVALHDAMGLLNTDEAAIMDLLRGRSQAEIDAIRAEYETRFDEPLDVALNDGLDEGNEQDQASALLCGDRATADSIALDEAMRGGVFGWGTSEEEIESTYQRVRNEVQAQAEQEGWNSQQMEAEIRRRSQAIEARFNERYANVEQYNAPGLEGESVLRRAISSEMNPGPERDLANALADNDMLEADMARIEIERRSVYASDETINNVLRSQYERSLQATRLDQGPARRMTIQRQLDEIVRNNRNITEEELSSHRFRLEHQMQRDMEGEAQRRSCISMDALQNAYSERHGLPLSLVLAFNMSGNDYSRARAMLRQGGRLTPLQEIEYATRGLGTDEDAIRNRITGMTRAEIQELRQQWELRHPGQCFNDMLRGELSGRDESDIMDMVEHGAPESASERIAQERRRMNRELDDLTGVLGGVAAGSEEAWLRRQMRELDDLEPRLHRTDLSPEERVALRNELDMRVQRVEEAVKDHRRAIDSVTDTATQIVGLVVGVTVGAALTILSGGALGPVMIAVLASVAATLATMGTKQLIQGGSYGGEEIGVDLAVGVVDALTAAATAGMGGRILRGAGGAAQRALRPTQATRLAGRLSQSALGQRIGRLPGVQGIRSGMSRLNQLETGVLTRGITGQNPLARMARSNSQNMRIMAGLMAEGIENAVSAAPAAFVQTALTDETWEGNVALNLLQGTAMGVGTGVVMGGVMQGAGHLYHGARGRIRLSTPEGRLMEANRILGDSFQGFRERHPDASYFDFLSHPDGMRAQAEVQERGLLPGAEPSAVPRPADAVAPTRPEAEPTARPVEPSRPPAGVTPAPRSEEAVTPQHPETEPSTRPAEPGTVAPDTRAAIEAEPGTVRTAEAEARAEVLRSALPEGMRENVPVDVNPELTGRTVRVRPDIEGGLVVGVRIEAGPDARPIDIMMHAPVVQGMQRYSGLLGRVRSLMERIRAWHYLETPIGVGSTAWEVRLELRKLPAIVQERMNSLSRPDLDPVEQARILVDVEHLSRQIDKHQQAIETRDTSAGRGFVAAEDRPAGAPVHPDQEVGTAEAAGATAVKPKTPVTAAQVRAQREQVNATKAQLEDLAQGKLEPRLREARDSEAEYAKAMEVAEDALETLAVRRKISVEELEEDLADIIIDPQKEPLLDTAQKRVRLIREKLSSAQDEVRRLAIDAPLRRAKLEAQMETQRQQLEALREERASQTEDWPTRKRNMGDEYRDRDSDGLVAFEDALSSRITAGDDAPVLKATQQDDAALLRRWGDAVKMLHDRLPANEQQQFAKDMADRLGKMPDDISNDDYDDFRRWLRKGILDHVMNQPPARRMTELNNFLYKRKEQTETALLPDSGSIGEFFHQFRERDILARFEATGGKSKITTLSEQNARNRTVAITDSASAIGGKKRKADGFVEVTEAIPGGPQQQGVYLSEDKSGKSFSREQALAYHQMMNQEGDKQTLTTALPGEKQYPNSERVPGTQDVHIEVGSKSPSIRAGEDDYEGVIYFFQNEGQATRAKEFMDSDCNPPLDSRIHIAVMTENGPVFIR